MTKLYYCSKCGKPIDVYNNKIPNDESCICCCQTYEKLPIPDKYIKYISGVVPAFNYDLTEEFVDEVLKNTPNFEETLSWFKRKDELVQKFSNDWQTIKAIQQQASNIPKCPTCGSPNVQKIGFGEKLESGVLWGLFSPKIHKSYKCKNCKYMW